MLIPEIAFRQIRPHGGSQAGAFEELCCQLAWLEPRPVGARHYRKGPGPDGGVECFTRFADGSETGWQAKYSWAFDSTLKRSLNGSIEQALDRYPALTTYIVCLPFDFPGSSQASIDEWETWRSGWVAKAAENDRQLVIERWGAAEIKAKLTAGASLHAGRILYWFGTVVLDASWFRKRFEQAKSDLGNRYTEVTHVDLPIRQALLGMARDPALKREIERLRGAWHGRRMPGPDGKFDPAVEAAVAELNEALATEPEPAELYPLNLWRACLEKVKRCEEEAFVRANLSAPDGGRNWYLERGVKREIDKLHDAMATTALSLNTAPLWSHVNDRCLLITGPGGIGKSHLLADVAAHQINAGRPAVLLLGQHFSDADPWPQIVDRLELPAGTSTDQFLGALDAAGQATGVKALLIIDALNERHGHRFWPNHLAGFLHKASAFPHIAVVLSCRTTYLDRLVPSHLDEQALPRREHVGFSSLDVRAYLAMRGIVLHGSPLPAPGFENPLLLRTLCDALEREGLREIPRGMTSATAVFEFYLSEVAKNIEARLDLDARDREVRRTVDTLAGRMADLAEEHLPFSEARKLVAAVRPPASREKDILFQLECEGVLVAEPAETGDEAIRFTFQRFSDHVIAHHLLETHVDAAEPAAAFAPDGPLHDYVAGDRSWSMAGVLEALAVQLPERFAVELPDVGERRHHSGVWEAFRSSLLWRDQSHFTQRTMQLAEELPGQHVVWRVMLTVASEPDNDFNADHLDNILRPLPMPERDAEWSIPLAELGKDETSPVWTLIDWAWDSGMERVKGRLLIAHDRSKLAGVALTWFLTTSHRAVRDRATKALTSLLSIRPHLAVALLRRFWDVDDDYLRERLVAAIYGALLQGQMKAPEVGTVAAEVFTLVFAAGTPPVNALLRDHARHIVDYAASRDCLPPEIDPVQARPPYTSPWPLEFVPDAVIDGYRKSRGGGSYSDDIVSSCIHDGDFARYIIDRYVGHWTPAPIGTKHLPSTGEVASQWLADFERDASPEARQALATVLRRKEECAGAGWEPTPERAILEDAEQAFRQLIPPEVWEDYRSRFRGWWNHGLFERGVGPATTFDLAWARRWVCKRAHDLGWSEDLHEDFDGGPLTSRGRSTLNRIERIGKKYQWLALYEIGARLADNCAFNPERRRTAAPYDGERFWRLCATDPSMLLRKGHDDGMTSFDAPCWWSPILPRFRRIDRLDLLKWLYVEADRIDGLPCIEVAAPEGRQWLVLRRFIDVQESGERQFASRRDSWSRVTCCVVPTSTFKTALEKLRRRILIDPDDIPQEKCTSTRTFLGELPLSSELRTCDRVANLPVSASPVVAEYRCEHGNYDYAIDETVLIELPAPWLARAMTLRMIDGRRAAFADAAGTVLFMDPSLTERGPSAALVDREAFFAAMSREGLAPIWVVGGERGLYGSTPSSFGGRDVFTTLYWREGSEWRHETHSEYELPTTEQVKAFLKGDEVPQWVRTRDP